MESPLVALSWLKLPCALKAAIGIGKQTLGHPASLPRPQGPQQGPGSGRPPSPPNTLWRHAFGGTREARRLALSASGIALAWVYETGG
jgi:hypothetical protein